MIDQLRRRVGITGSGGFIGSCVTAAFIKHGWEIVALGRRPPSRGDLDFRSYDLAQPAQPGLADGLEAIVHLAYDRAADAAGLDGNVLAASSLFGRAREAGARIVFVSSLAASRETRSEYGRNKMRVEDLLDTSVDAIVRPGLVTGRGGLYGAMRSVIHRFGLAPIFDGGRQPVYLVDILELAAAIVDLTEQGFHGLATCASDEPIEMRSLLLAIGAVAGRAVRLIPFPLGPTLACMAGLEAVGIRSPIPAESLRGIANLREMRIVPPQGLSFSPPQRCVESAEARDR